MLSIIHCSMTLTNFLLGTMKTEGIRFRLYTFERFKREKFLAEVTIMFADINLDEDMCKIFSLKGAYVYIYT